MSNPTINNIPPSTGRMLTENGNTVNIADLLSFIGAGAGYVKPTNYLYVGKNGNDTTGDGSANLPFLTVQKAIDTATSGTAIFIFPGTYTENLNFKAGVYLTAPNVFSVYITGNHTVNFNGTIVCNNIVFNSTSGITLKFSGTTAQNFQLYNSSVYSTNGDAIYGENTNSNSKIILQDGTCVVSNSVSDSARAVYMAYTCKTTIIANRFTFKVNDSSNVCISLNGYANFTHTSDAIVGEVVMADYSNATIAMVSLTASNVPVLMMNSAGMSAFINVTVNTNVSPAINGVGGHTFVAVLYTNTGVGGSPTLNGGLGSISLPMSSIKLRNSNLLPSGQVASGQNSGALEFDGTDLYFTAGTTRKKVAFQS